jgi:hypothetical protein
MESLRINLHDTLSKQFTNESQRAVNRLREGITPYTRYVRGERERIEKTETTLASLKQKLSALRARSQTVIGK